MLNAKVLWRTILANTILPNNITTLPVSNGSTSYTLSTTAINANWNNSVMTIPADGNKVVIEKKAALEVKGKMIVNGVDLEERLKTIEEVLHIPERDVILEEKYPKLKKMYDEYVRTLKKYRTWETLKGDENG